MSRIKFLVPIVVLFIVLFWSVTAIAQNYDLDNCMPNCYASNVVLSGTSAPGNGTSAAPWIVPTQQERLNLRQTIVNGGYSGSLTIIICDNPQQCAYVLYQYENGVETAGEPQPGIPPEVGVDLPFFYILVGGVILGFLLVGGGVILWRRARLLNSIPNYSGA